jgi:O-antigen/teichoic acid export membrane protein
MVILIIPIAVGTTLLAEPIISFFYKDQFLPSISALQILVWSEVFVFIGVVNNHILIASNKQKIDFIFTSNSAVINVLLNLLLIPKYSFVGAAVATVISYSVGPIMGVFIPATRDYSTAAFKSMIKPFIASIGMGGYICYVSSFNLMFLISTSSIIYFGMLLLIKGLTKEKEEERLFVPTQKHYR